MSEHNQGGDKELAKKAPYFTNFEVGTIVMSSWLFRNSLTQSLVANGWITPPVYSRLHAFKCTLGFMPGTVGSGANFGIQLIQMLGGNIGEMTIGNYFDNVRSQQRMGTVLRTRSDRPNLQLAGGEYRFWAREYFCATSRIIRWPTSTMQIEQLIGGYGGSRFSTWMRAQLQFEFSKARLGAPTAFSPQMIYRVGGLAGLFGVFLTVYNAADRSGIFDPINGKSGAENSS